MNESKIDLIVKSTERVARHRRNMESTGIKRLEISVTALLRGKISEIAKEKKISIGAATEILLRMGVKLYKDSNVWAHEEFDTNVEPLQAISPAQINPDQSDKATSNARTVDGIFGGLTHRPSEPVVVVDNTPQEENTWATAIRDHRVRRNNAAEKAKMEKESNFIKPK